jgi:anti-anti-sigma regulatory factor
MNDTALQVTTRSSPGGELVLAVEGYLDEDGGFTLARETRAARLADHRHICIDLAAVCLFTCSGARHLISLLHDLNGSGCQVNLVGVHLPLQRLLNLAA